MNEEKNMKRSGQWTLFYIALSLIIYIVFRGSGSLLPVIAIIIVSLFIIKHLLAYMRQLSDYNSKFK